MTPTLFFIKRRFMEFKFPDSGRTVKIEGLSFLTISLLRGWYDQNFAGKPTVPTITFGDVTEPNPKDEQYVKDLAVWSSSMRQSQWAAVKAYYASCITDDSIEPEAVEQAVKSVSSIMDLRQTILDGYNELHVQFDPSILDKYIYLFHVCITNSSEQTLFEDAIMLGSQATQEVVAQTMFRYRSKV